MLDTASLALFAGANLVVLITPGPSVIYTVCRSLDQGRRAGLLSVYGLALGTFPHALAVAFGVAGVLASSVVAFSILKYIGAVYLVYLGVCRMLRKSAVHAVDAKKPKAGAAAFLESIAVGLTNPKSVLFFLAFLPQFVDPSRGHPVVQTLLLWLISQLMAVIVGSGYALAAAWLRYSVVTRKALSATGDYIAGSVYIGMGLAAALTGSKGK